MIRMLRVFTCVVLSVAVVACSSSGKKPKPVSLEPLKPQIAGRMVWSQRVDSVSFPLSVAVNGEQFTLASGGGTVLALDAASGREIWRANVGAKLSAGVGSDGRFAAVVTADGELVAIDKGRLTWRKPMGTRIVTAPLVAGDRVFVLGVDRSVSAFDAQDGSKLWSVQRPNDPLTLASAGGIAPFKNTLVVGQGARMAGLDPQSGAVRWEVSMASPRGTNEIERLADLVGPFGRVDDALCARAFQASVGCVNAERGALMWSKNLGGIEGVAADAQYVFAADASDRITAWKTPTGEVAWTSESLLNHDLGAPASIGRAVVFGAADGMLHFLSRDTGVALLRLPTDGSAIQVPPVVSGTTLLVVTRNGGLFAFRPE